MLRYSVRQGMNPNELPKVYYCSGTADAGKYFDKISEEILKLNNCAIWYKENSGESCDFDQLEEMQLVVIPVTYALLTGNNEVFEKEYAFFSERHTAILPIMLETGLDTLFERKFGSIQYLSRISSDITEISYMEKLEKRLKSVLVDDSSAKRIRNAFDGYIFVSYRKKDRKHARRLINLIHDNDRLRDYATWYDEFLIPGENYNKLIQDNLEKSDFFSLVVTPNVLEDNNYIITHEYPAAIELKKPVLPFMAVDTDKSRLSVKYTNIPPCLNTETGRDIEKAFEKLIPAKNKRYEADHDFLMGLAYLTGTDVEMNKERGLRLIESASRNCTEAKEKLVDIYEMGDGVAPDYGKAAEYQSELNDIYKRKYSKNPTEKNGSALSEGLLRYARLLEEQNPDYPKIAIVAYKEYVDFLEELYSAFPTSERLADILCAYVKISELQLKRNSGNTANRIALWYYEEKGNNDDSPGVRKALARIYASQVDENIHFHYELGGSDWCVSSLTSFSRITPISKDYYGFVDNIATPCKKARDILTQLIKEEPDDSLSAELARLDIKQCRIMHIYGDFAKAEEIARAVIDTLSGIEYCSESPLMADAYEAAALSCLFQGKHEEALLLYEKAFCLMHRISEKTENPMDYRHTYYTAYALVCVSLICRSDKWREPLEAAMDIFNRKTGEGFEEMAEIHIMLKRINEVMRGIDDRISDGEYFRLVLLVFTSPDEASLFDKYEEKKGPFLSENGQLIARTLRYKAGQRYVYFLKDTAHYFFDQFSRRTESCYLIFIISMKLTKYFPEDKEGAELYRELSLKAISYLLKVDMVSIDMLSCLCDNSERIRAFSSFYELICYNSKTLSKIYGGQGSAKYTGLDERRKALDDRKNDGISKAAKLDSEKASLEKRLIEIKERQEKRKRFEEEMHQLEEKNQPMRDLYDLYKSKTSLSDEDLKKIAMLTEQHIDENIQDKGELYDTAIKAFLINQIEIMQKLNEYYNNYMNISPQLNTPGR